MHSMTLQIDDSVYQKFLTLLELFPENKLKITHQSEVEDPLKTELQERMTAIDNGDIAMVSSERFWERMDRRIEAFKNGD